MDNIKNILMNSRFKQELTVDKLVDNSKNDKNKLDVNIIVRKPKTLRINLQQGVLESNLIEIPFINYGIDKKSKELITLIEYRWTDSNGIDRGVEVRGSGKHGVPKSFEFDVLIALLRVYVKSNKIILNRDNLSFDAITDDDISIDFTLTQLAKEMGYTRPNGELLNKIVIALEILTDTTIYNRYGGGIYDIESKKYIEDNMIAFHIIEQFEATLYKDSKKKRTRGQDIKQKVKLNKFFYKSIANNYFKFYNHIEYVGISTSIGKKLFLIFNKWRNNKDFLKLKCETLYQRIPLDVALPAHRKNQMLKRALDSLKVINFILNYELKNGYVTVNFVENNELISADDSMYFKTRYNEYNEITDKLTNVGFSKDDISTYLSAIVFENNYIKALLRYTDMQVKYGKVEDEKGFIIAGLKKKYNIDDKYFN